MEVRVIVQAVTVTASVVLAACSSSSEPLTAPSRPERPGAVAPPSQPPNDQSSCTAANATWAIGQPATDALLEKARQAANAATARFIVQGEPITTEYLGTRLNLETDVQRIVRAVGCG